MGPDEVSAAPASVRSEGGLPAGEGTGPKEEEAADAEAAPAFAALVSPAAGAATGSFMDKGGRMAGVTNGLTGRMRRGAGPSVGR